MVSESISSDPDVRDSDGGSARLTDHPVTLLSTAGGYLFALFGALAGGWALPLFLGTRLDWTRRATGLFASDGALVTTAFRVAFASFPLVFAVCVVAIDGLLVRALVTDARPNRPGLFAWWLLASAGFAVLLLPITQVLPPYGLVRLLSTPVLGLVVIATTAVAGGVAAICGRTIPVALYCDGRSLRAAVEQAGATARNAPGRAITAARPVLVSWTLGSALLVGGVALLGLAFGLFVFGIFLLPGVFLAWCLAAVAFAVGHLRYRLRTVQSPVR